MAGDKLPDRNDLAERSWHAVSGEEALDTLASDGERGLSEEEAQRRQQAFGENKLPEQKRETILKTLLRQFKDPLIYILLVAAVVAAQAVHIVSMFIPGWRDVLEIDAVSVTTWLMLLVITLSKFLIVEAYKHFRGRGPAEADYRQKAGPERQ